LNFTATRENPVSLTVDGPDAVRLREAGRGTHVRLLEDHVRMAYLSCILHGLARRSTCVSILDLVHGALRADAIFLWR